MFEILRMKRKKENVIELPGVNRFQEQINCVTSFLKSVISVSRLFFINILQ